MIDRVGFTRLALSYFISERRKLMICAIQNAFPNNNCIDGGRLPEFKFTFCGDYSNCAQFFICDYETHKVQGNRIFYDTGKYSDGIYNGEEVGIRNWGNYTLTQNSDYVWYARIFERVDFTNGYYPTQYVFSGKTAQSPYQFVNVAEFPIEVTDKTYIPVDSTVLIETPCYLYYNGVYKAIKTIENKVGTLGTAKAMIKISSEFDEYPAVGTELVICKYKTKTTDAMDVAKAGNCIYIEPNLSINTDTHSIPNQSSDVANTYIKIGSSYSPITKYYPKTGIIVTDGTISIAEGTDYEIYSCFYQTPDYYFTTKATPVVTPTMEFVDEVIRCRADINTSGNYPVKYYYWTIYKDGIQIDRSQKIYSGRLEYLFREIESGVEYTGNITVVTQDNVEVTSSLATCVFDSTDIGIKNLKAVYDENKCAVKLTWDNVAVPSGYVILRKVNGETKFLETLNVSMTNTYYDYSCANNMEYEYIVVPKSNTKIYKQESVKITPFFEDYYIYFLQQEAYSRPSTSITDTRVFYEYMYGDEQYHVSRTWVVQLDPEIDDIAHNIHRQADDTYFGKPAVTYGNKDYDSFTLKFTMGQIDCKTDGLTGYDQRTFELWKSDINSKKPVMIKDTKGNVWFGTLISHNYSIEYDVPKYQPYNITVEFVQTRDMSKTRILSN